MNNPLADPRRTGPETSVSGQNIPFLSKNIMTNMYYFLFWPPKK